MFCKQVKVTSFAGLDLLSNNRSFLSFHTSWIPPEGLFSMLVTPLLFFHPSISLLRRWCITHRDCFCTVGGNPQSWEFGSIFHAHTGIERISAYLFHYLPDRDGIGIYSSFPCDIACLAWERPFLRLSKGIGFAFDCLNYPKLYHVKD